MKFSTFTILICVAMMLVFFVVLVAERDAEVEACRKIGGKPATTGLRHYCLTGGAA